MAKYIKRAGIIFFVLACSFLIAICNLYKANDSNYKDISTANSTNDSVVMNNSITEYELGGTNEEMVNIWNTAIEESDSKKKNVYVKLTNDWIAQTNSANAQIFGSGAGFSNGRPSVVRGAEITLDLNGFKIDKQMNLDSAQGDTGCVFIIYGTLNLKDSSYNSEEVHTNYNELKNDKDALFDYLESSNLGRITGGRKYPTTNGGGAIYVGGTLNMYGGLLFKNYASKGGALYADTNGIINIYDGLIVGNQSPLGGAIYSDRQVNIYGGIIAYNNTHYDETTDSTQTPMTFYGHGGAITAIKNVLIENCIIENNFTMYRGGAIYVYDTGNLTLGNGVQFNNNMENTDIPNDIFLSTGRKIMLKNQLTSNSEILMSFDDNYDIFSTFTLGYNYFGNIDIDPSTLFKTNDSNKIATIKNEEVMFKSTLQSIYDFVYLQDDKRLSYKDNNKLHGYNDSDLNIVDGTTRFVLGGITPNTSVTTFINNIASLGIDNKNVQIYDANRKLVYENGQPQNNITQDMLNNNFELAVGTGWSIKANGEEIYLSVLGDINGDGRISASDVTYLRDIAQNKSLYDNLSVEQKLASLIINKGAVTTADAEIARNVIEKLLRIDLFL